MIENDYFAWYPIKPNEYALIHVLHDKKRDLWYFVHATMHRFPAQKVGNSIEGVVSFNL